MWFLCDGEVYNDNWIIVGFLCMKGMIFFEKQEKEIQILSWKQNYDVFFCYVDFFDCILCIFLLYENDRKSKSGSSSFFTGWTE